MYCSSKYRFAFCVGEFALLCSSSHIVQVKAKAHCRGLGRRAYMWTNTHLLLPLGWVNYMHSVYKNQHATVFYWNILLGRQTWGTVQPQTWFVSSTAPLRTVYHTSRLPRSVAALRTFTRVPCALTLLLWVCSSFIRGMLASYASIHPFQPEAFQPLTFWSLLPYRFSSIH